MTFSAASLMNCLAESSQMAGTVITQRIQSSGTPLVASSSCLTNALFRWLNINVNRVIACIVFPRQSSITRSLVVFCKNTFPTIIWKTGLIACLKIRCKLSYVKNSYFQRFVCLATCISYNSWTRQARCTGVGGGGLSLFLTFFLISKYW